MVRVECVYRRQVEFVEEAALAALQPELASFQIVSRRHEHDIAVLVLAEQADELRVHESTVDSDLVFDELDEGLPYFGRLVDRLRHQSLRVAGSLLLKLLGDDERLFRHVRSDLAD